MAFRDDGVTFDGKMGQVFIKYSAFYPHLWVVSEMPTHQLICHTLSSVLNCAGNEKMFKCSFLFGVGGRGKPGLSLALLLNFLVITHSG